jgi:hypothetical protein
MPFDELPRPRLLCRASSSKRPSHGSPSHAPELRGAVTELDQRVHGQNARNPALGLQRRRQYLQGPPKTGAIERQPGQHLRDMLTNLVLLEIGNGTEQLRGMRCKQLRLLGARFLQRIGGPEPYDFVGIEGRLDQLADELRIVKRIRGEGVGSPFRPSVPSLEQSADRHGCSPLPPQDDALAAKPEPCVVSARQYTSTVPVLGVCGDNCSECPRFLATKSGDRAQLGVLAALWVKLGFRDTLPRPEEMECRGCSPANLCAYPDQRRCAVERGLSNCGECGEYPCEVAARGLERSDAAADRCRRLCSPQEWATLRRAFLNKRENLATRRP